MQIFLNNFFALMNLLSVFLLLFVLRVASVFVVQTFYVPDEYWQSLEVAHKLVFGYGYLTWEWVQGVRSYLYPLAIAGVYKLLALLKQDTTYLLVLLPRVLQAILSAYSDYRFFVWCGKKKWALFSIIVSWFWFYIASRTLTNTLEASLTTIALSYFPWYGESSAYLWPVGFCCYIRPTAGVLWLPLVIHHLRKSKYSWTKLIFQHFLPVGLIISTVCISIDSWMYDRLLISPYEFLKYNIFHNIGSFYGSHDWYWYITVGLPTVLGISYLPFLCGVIDTLRNWGLYPIRRILLLTIFFSVMALSVVEHKEFRFLSSILPLCLYITSDTLTKWSYHARRFSLWCVAIMLIIGNAVPALYLSIIHQRGPIEVVNRLYDTTLKYRDENHKPASVLFLMPCHSTPYYSHIHQNISMRFLTCEPNFKQKPNYKDEADQFYESPVHWLRSHIPSYPRTAKPTHVILYEPLSSQINEFLIDYKLLYRIANGEYVQPRTGTGILLYQRLRSGEENKFNREEYIEQWEKTDQLKPQNIEDFEDEFEIDGNMFN